MRRREMRTGDVIEWLFCPNQTRRYHHVSINTFKPSWEATYKNTTAWFSPRLFNLVYALLARSSASPIPLPILPPFWPLVDEVNVLIHISPCDESRAVGRETW